MKAGVVTYIRRHEVIEYVTKKYGSDKVAQIGTFSTMSTRAVFKDIGRALGIDHTIINDMNKLIPMVQGKTLSIDESLEEVPEMAQYEKMYPEMFRLARQVESMPRSSSIHACGILITPEPIVESAPLMRGKEGEVVTQYDGPTLEKLGFIKFDFLGLKNLSVLNICRELVRERHGKDIDPDALEPEDPHVFTTIQQGNTDGLFQIESDGMKKMFKSMNEVTFESLIAGVSLYRPGPMAYIPDYCDRANGYTEVTYPCKELEDITQNTFGIAIYQEQIMKMTQVLGGYSAGQADAFRKAIGKKSQAVLDVELPKLRKAIVENKFSEQIADHVIKVIEPFVGYG